MYTLQRFLRQNEDALQIVNEQAFKLVNFNEETSVRNIHYNLLAWKRKDNIIFQLDGGIDRLVT